LPVFLIGAVLGVAVVKRPRHEDSRYFSHLDARHDDGEAGRLLTEKWRGEDELSGASGRTVAG
jgi:hypothetical protein